MRTQYFFQLYGDKRYRYITEDGEVIEEGTVCSGCGGLHRTISKEELAHREYHS